MQLQKDDSVQIFKQFIDKLKQLNVQQLLQNAQQNYAVREFKLSQLLLNNSYQIYQNIATKFNRNLVSQSQLNWWENQLRIFVWTLVLYVHLNSTKVQTLTIDDWSFFSSIFPHKKLILFQYQSINILKEHNQAKKWTSQQDELFIKLVNEKGLKCKWSQLAKLLYIYSDKKYFRTPKQCRQRWLNHLDPSKSKSEWETREDFILIRYVYEKQKKWAEISKLLHNKRNQHSIKNRFKSLITKQLKFHKQKLTEKELIESIYHRYKTHLSKNDSQNRIVDQKEGVKLNSKQNIEGLNVIEQRSQYFPSQSNLGMNRLSLGRNHSESQMYPFTWYSKHESFVPFRKSQEYFPFSTYENSEPDIKRNFISPFSNNLEGLNMRSKLYGQNQHQQVHGNWELNKDKLFNTWVDKHKQQIEDKKAVKTQDNFFTVNNHNLPINNSHIIPSHNNILALHNTINSIPLQNNNSIPLQNNNSIPLQNNNSIPLQNNNSIPLQSNNRIAQDKNHLVAQVKRQYRNFPVPNEHYEPDNHFYSDLVLNSGFGSSSQIQLGSNYEQFLPFEQNESIQNNIMKDNEINKGELEMNGCIDKRGMMIQQMDEEERKIRAELFLFENPMDIVKQYFYSNKNNCSNMIQNQSGY